jgi:hypothetical protein
MSKRGIRNNNPGNIERNKTRWQGMSLDQSRDGRFIVFDHAKWGIRAIARVLITYQDKRQADDGSDIDTISEIIDRWAPPFENPTKLYASHISNMSGIGVNEYLDVYEYNTMFQLVKSIIQFENGIQPYSDETINQGLRLAGIGTPVKPLSKSRTIKAASTASVTTTAVVVLEGANEMLSPLAPYVDSIQYVLLAVTMFSIGITVWARIDDANKEGR